VVRNAGFLVWDMLYGIDANFEPQPQMCEGHEVASDGKTWTFRLRPGLRFHDNEPVRAGDAAASIRRWMERDVMAGRLKTCLDAIETIADRTFRLRLNKPFPKLLYAFGKSTTVVLLVMPERIAATDPFKPITEFVGSGPMRFRRDEWVVGASAAFERFPGYQPRPEPAAWLAGGRRMGVDRIEWVTMPDAATASAALQNGEVDWWENPIPDLAPMLKRSRGVQIDIADPLGNVACCRPNCIAGPTNKAQGDVIAEALKAIGMNVDYQAVDWGQQASRIALKAPVNQGGWNIYLTWVAGAECANPAGHKMVDCSGPAASFGWPDSPEVQAALGDWFDAASPAAEQEPGARANRAAMDYVPFIPTGFFLGYTAWRRGVEGIVKSPFPTFWDVRKP